MFKLNKHATVFNSFKIYMRDKTQFIYRLNLNLCYTYYVTLFINKQKFTLVKKSTLNGYE